MESAWEQLGCGGQLLGCDSAAVRVEGFVLRVLWQNAESGVMQAYFTQCINAMVLESQLLHKIVDSLITMSISRH